MYQWRIQKSVREPNSIFSASFIGFFFDLYSFIYPKYSAKMSKNATNKPKISIVPFEIFLLFLKKNLSQNHNRPSMAAYETIIRRWYICIRIFVYITVHFPTKPVQGMHLSHIHQVCLPPHFYAPVTYLL